MDAAEHIVALVRHPDGAVEKLPEAELDRIDDLVASDGLLVWVSALRPTEAQIGLLQREFMLHPLAIEDLRRRGQRPKLDAYAGQHMVVAYEVDAAAAELTEVHLFVGPGWLLSVQWAAAPLIDAARRRFATRGDGPATSTGTLLYTVLDAAVDSYFPELDRISERIDELEDRLLEGASDAASLREILAIKRRLLELRRLLAPMRDVANRLLRRDLELVEPAAMPYYQDLYDHLVRVLDQLDVSRDLLATVLDARATVASNSLNAIMKRLTALTVTLMLPTLIAGIYGMNFDTMPELSWPLGYPLALILMITSIAAAITFFRRRGWF